MLARRLNKAEESRTEQLELSVLLGLVLSTVLTQVIYLMLWNADTDRHRS